MDRTRLEEMIAYVDAAYVRFGAPKKVFGGDPERTAEFIRLASKNDLEFVPTRIRHIGTDRCLKVLQKMQLWLDKAKVRVLFDTQAERVLTEKDRAVGVRLADGAEHRADYVILAPGREGSKWLEGESRRLKLPTLQNPVDIGVRVEIPASVMEHLTSAAYEPKLLYSTKLFDDRVPRTPATPSSDRGSTRCSTRTGTGGAWTSSPTVSC